MSTPASRRHLDFTSLRSTLTIDDLTIGQLRADNMIVTLNPKHRPQHIDLSEWLDKLNRSIGIVSELAPPVMITSVDQLMNYPDSDDQPFSIQFIHRDIYAQ